LDLVFDRNRVFLKELELLHFVGHVTVIEEVAEDPGLQVHHPLFHVVSRAHDRGRRHVQELEDEVEARVAAVFAQDEDGHDLHKSDPRDHRIPTIVIGGDYVEALKDLRVQFQFGAEDASGDFDLVLCVRLKISIFLFDGFVEETLEESDDKLPFSIICNVISQPELIGSYNGLINIFLQVLDRYEVLSQPLHELVV